MVNQAAELRNPAFTMTEERGLCLQRPQRPNVLWADAAAAADDVGAALQPGFGERGIARRGEVGADVAEAVVGGFLALRREGVGVDADAGLGAARVPDR